MRLFLYIKENHGTLMAFQFLSNVSLYEFDHYFLEDFYGTRNEHYSQRPFQVGAIPPVAIFDIHLFC